jgi:hypothetical protein
VGVFLFGLALLSTNYFYTTRCLASPAAEEGSYAELLERRLLAAESAVHRNSLLVDQLVLELEKRLSAQEKALLAKLTQQAQQQGVALAQQLAKMPAPPLPDLTWSAQFEDPNQMNQMLDDAFEGALYDDMKVQTSKDRRKKPRDGQDSKDKDDDGAGAWADQYADDDVPEAAAPGEGADPQTQCQEWARNYGVIPGTSWGRLPFDLQQKWKGKNCDYYV